MSVSDYSAVFFQRESVRAPEPTPQRNRHNNRPSSKVRATPRCRRKLIVTKSNISGKLPGVEDTPMGTQKKKFKFFCPLCMLHFMETFETTCCNNYICYNCTLEYVKGKGVGLHTDAKIVPRTVSEKSVGKDGNPPESCTCPHCASAQLVSYCKFRLHVYMLPSSPTATYREVSGGRRPSTKLC